MRSFPTFETPSHLSITCWAAETVVRPINPDCEVQLIVNRDTT